MTRIRDVWAPNLEIEMRNIREAIDKYPYIAMVRVQTLQWHLPRLLTAKTWIGYRIPWRRGSAYRLVQDVVGLPLPDYAV
jgi:hypothetical protein